MAALCAGPVVFHIPQAPGGRVFSFPSGAGRSLRTFFPSLRRRALAPLAWLRALRRAGAVAPAGPLRGPVPLISHIARLPGARSARIARRRGRAGRAAARPGPAHLPHPWGHRSLVLRAACSPSPPLGAERAGVRWGPFCLPILLSPSRDVLAWLTRLAARRRGRAGRAAARPGPAHLPHPWGHRSLVLRAACSPSPPLGAERAGVRWGLFCLPILLSPSRDALARLTRLAARFPSPPTPRRLAAPRVSCRMRQHTGNPAKTRLRWRMLRR